MTTLDTCPCGVAGCDVGRFVLGVEERIDHIQFLNFRGQMYLSFGLPLLALQRMAASRGLSVPTLLRHFGCSEDGSTAIPESFNGEVFVQVTPEPIPKATTKRSSPRAR